MRISSINAAASHSFIQNDSSLIGHVTLQPLFIIEENLVRLINDTCSTDYEVSIGGLTDWWLKRNTITFLKKEEVAAIVKELGDIYEPPPGMWKGDKLDFWEYLPYLRKKNLTGKKASK